MEALTQRLPPHEAVAEPVLETVPAPFMGIAHCCLRRDPQRRCSAADIAERLRASSPSSFSKAISRAQGPSTLRIPAASAKWRYILPIAAVLLIAAAMILGPKLLKQNSESQPVSVSSQRPVESVPTPSAQRSGASAEQQAGEKPAGALEKSAAKPSARKPVPAKQDTASTPRASEPAPVASTPPAAEAPASTAGQGAVAQQVMPAVSKSARDTIHGTIKIRVKVRVDSAGNVDTASFVSQGPSKYFAGKAMEAAQQWKFVPGADARTWIVRFAFRRSGVDADLEPANP